MREHRGGPTGSPLLGTSMAKEISEISRTNRGEQAMADDKLDNLGPLMNEIGQELAEIVGGDPNGVFLYAEIGEGWNRSEEHTYELQSLMRNSYAVFCLKKKKT